MKKLEIITRPEKLEDLKFVLADHHSHGLTVTKVMGSGNQKGYVPELASLEMSINLLPKIYVMAVVNDNDYEEILTKICEIISTGNVGDGKVFVSEMVEAMRIRTGDRGNKAL